MKKKNIQLKKLTFTKTQIASLENSRRIAGGSAITCTEPEPSPLPNSEGDCITGPSGCLCPSMYPICMPTQDATCQNCITQQSCDGGFLCDNQTFGGAF